MDMREGRIDKCYLRELVMDYKFRKKLDKTFPMPDDLAEVIVIVIDKIMGAPRWRRYTDDWKEEFRGKAIEHCLKYAHNFDPTKSSSGKGDDPYNYFAMIATHAFMQSWKKCKAYSDANVSLNPDVLYKDVSDAPAPTEPPPPDSFSMNEHTLDWGGIS
jgi:hypothetical protein